MSNASREIYFVTAIGTDSGKTLVSAILAKALQADYWKPIQCGEPRDKDCITDWIRNMHSVIYNEAYFFKAPQSPHAAAKAEQRTIDMNEIHLPETDGNPLIIEGAGGVLVPLNDEHFVIDIAEKFNAKIILVANLYLGSINHTLLTIQELKRRNLEVKGIIFNGPSNPDSEEFILKYSQYPCLLRIAQEPHVDEMMVNNYAVKLFEHWYE